MHAGIVAPEEVRELTADERAQVEGFISDFTAGQQADSSLPGLPRHAAHRP